MGKPKSAPPRLSTSPRARTGAASVKQILIDAAMEDLFGAFDRAREAEAAIQISVAGSHYPDLVIRHGETIYLIEFFDKDERGMLALETAVMHARLQEYIRAQTTEPVKSFAVWVGEALVGPVASMRVGDTWAQCRLVDIRDSFEDDARLDAGLRQILGKLKRADQTHGGLFRRLLARPPQEHQREFVRIATKLGFRAAALAI